MFAIAPSLHAVAITAEMNAFKIDLPAGLFRTFANKTGAVIKTVANQLNIFEPLLKRITSHM